MPSEASTGGTEQYREPSVEDLKRELAEARRREAATAEVLRVIGTSATNVQPVFDTIVKSAVILCNGLFSCLFQFDGELVHLVAQQNWSPKALEEAHRIFPAPPNRLIVGRAILNRAVVYVPDVELDSELQTLPRVRAIGWRSGLFVPMLRDGAPIGAIVVTSSQPGHFSYGEIELLKTFADQAVIAIENTRLFEAEQVSKCELQESLEYQTAISEVLAVISRSPSNLQPVLDTIVETAARLLRGYSGTVTRVAGDQIELAALTSIDDAGDASLRALFPQPLKSEVAHALAIRDRAPINIADAQTDPRSPEAVRATARARGYRSWVTVPLLRRGEAVGTIGVTRRESGGFNGDEISLLQTFADQAVIAVENTRLFEEVEARTHELEVRTKELQESLEQQTATASMLGVISRSKFDLDPVLQSVIETAVHLCRAEHAMIYRLHEGTYRWAAQYGPIKPDYEDIERRERIPPGHGTLIGRVALEKRPVQITDALADPDYEKKDDARVGGVRSMLGVPILRDGEAIGVLGLVRLRVEPFSEREVDLVATFADQAVIAIENTRLFEEVQARTRELTESLQQQTGTADVLKVISRSAFDLQSVLQALVESAGRLCDADKGVIARQIDGVFYRAESYGFPAEVMERWRKLPVTPERGSAAGRALLEGRTVHVPDADADPDYAFGVAGVRMGSILGVPMLREGVPIGVLALARSDVRAFTDKQIDLVSTFADQAAIAIENVRLFEEVRARTSELAKTVEDLEIASQHKSQFVANMSHELRTPLAAILGYAELMQEGFYEAQGPKSLDALTRIRSNGKHLLGLINTVLDIAKIESGQFTLNMAEYAIESIVETVRSATESLAQNKKLALRTEVAKPLPIGVGDEQRLTQVLLNLVGNAIKFTDTGEVRVTAQAINGHFNVSVTDTGPGIPEEHQARIFEQFHQVDSSNTKAKGGTGLGLAIAKQIVEMHGGRIWVESTFGKGSTFQVELPTRAELRKRAQ